MRPVSRVWHGPANNGLGWTFAKVGRGCVIEDTAKIFSPETVTLETNVYFGHGVMIRSYSTGYIKIGENSWIGAYACIDGYGGVLISKNVAIGEHVVIHSAKHDLYEQRSIMKSKLRGDLVIIGEGCDIGAGTYIRPGVKIAEGVQVGANSVVLHDIPPMQIWVGNPARFVRERNTPMDGVIPNHGLGRPRKYPREPYFVEET